MAVLKYKDPVTGEIKKVGSPKLETYSKAESDAKFAVKYEYSTIDLTAGTSPLETGKLYFVYE